MNAKVGVVHQNKIKFRQKVYKNNKYKCYSKKKIQNKINNFKNIQILIKI